MITGITKLFYDIGTTGGRELKAPSDTIKRTIVNKQPLNKDLNIIALFLVWLSN